mmetsp:Transcript_30030/g.66055  ORF Transcript_30030/g.66055 Transcript_30030/m.66055 type:complete len:1225 (+) Transcript_30030:288-3962(+)
MGRKRKTAGASGGSNRGAGENADRSKAGSSEAAAHESVDSDAVSSDRGGKDGADTSRAMAAATVSTSPAGASGAGAGATVSAGPDVVPPSDVSPTVSSSLQAGLAQALRGVKKIAGFEQTAEAELTFAKAEGLLKSGATGPAAELLAQSLKMDTDKDGKVSLRFSPPLSNDVLKDMVDQAVANDASGGNVSSKSSVGIAGAAVTKTEVVIEAAPQQGKKRDASGGWKVTKTSVMSAPLKPPAPAFGTDIADIDEDRLAVAVHAAEAAIRKIPADLDWQAEKDILENKSASTDAVSKSAIVSAVNSEYDDKKKGGRRNNGSFDDEDVDGDYDEDDGDDDASDEIVEIDNEDGGANLEEVDSDGVVGVCLHCSRPRTKSKQIKTKSPNDVDVDELVEDALDLSDPMALDSSRRPRAVQVSCDDCHSFICTACHWCHEYQANHEIRVCDRCDAFYCRGCDEMDQCEDCSEVVCGGCSTLMSCKFCGCGLCEDCATACGRCGIVLCSRDAKFAVECDTCRMSYCLVCLASGTKDPCVRCGHRPSKRVEQLVHLRLKSIYKAFKQSGASLGPGKGGDQSLPPLEDDFGDGKAKGGKAAAAAALARAAGMANLPAGKGKGGKSGNDDFGPDGLAGDVGAVLQAAAAAAAAGANSNRRGGHGHGHGDGHDVDGHGGAGSGRNRYDPSFDNHAANAHPQSHRGSSIKPSESDKYAAKTEEEADAAAAALLAELDMEDGKAAASAGKKSKKKKKKERERAEKAAVAEAEAKAADDAARAMEEAEAAKAEAAANAKSKKKKTKKKGGGGGNNNRNSNKDEDDAPPTLGDDSTPIDEVHAFYDYWTHFDSWRDFTLKASESTDHDVEMADSRDEKRWMSKEIDRKAKALKREEVARIALLVERSMAADPRLRREREREREEKKRLAEEKERQRIELERKEAEEKARKEKEEAERIAKEKQEKAASKARKDQEKKQLRKAKQLLWKLAVAAHGKATTAEDKVWSDIESMHGDVDVINDNLATAAILTVAASLGGADADGNVSKVKVEGLKELKRRSDEIRNDMAEEKKAAAEKREQERAAAAAKEAQAKAEKAGRPWTKKELTSLAKAVKKYPPGGSNRWDAIALFINNQCKQKEGPRTREECIERYNITAQGPPGAGGAGATDSADAGADSQAWTEKQDKFLQNGLAKYTARTYPDKNERWGLIADGVPGKNKKECVQRFKEIREALKNKKKKGG